MMKQIAIIAFGTRGDVQPAIALGKTLQERGHRVWLLASANFTEWIQSHNLDVEPSDVDIQEMMQSGAGQAWVEQGTNPLAQLRMMRRLMAQHGDEMARAAWDGCQGAQVVISSFTSDVLAVSIAEKLNAVHVSMPPQPAMIATRDGRAVPHAPLPNRVSLINYLFSRLFLQPFPWQLQGKSNNYLRQEVLGLPPQSQRENTAARRRMLVVHAHSRHVVPHPADWPDNFHTTGYWFLEEENNWTAPAALRDFLESGPPPVYIGFGSMTERDPAGLTQLILDAVRRSGRRALLLSGWAGIGDMDLPDDVFCIDRAPHDLIFPKMSAIVHHGGAGTTGASLRAGVPTVIVPHMADQPYWGRRMSDLGVGPEPIPRPRLTAERLAQAIRATSDEGMCERAAELGRRIRAEDGRKRAADLIEAWIRRKEAGQPQASGEEG